MQGKSESVSDTLGSRIRLERVLSGVSVRELARRTGVSPSLISQIERGRVMPSVGTLYAIASELELSMDGLFTETRVTRSAAEVHSGAARVPSLVQPHDNRKAIGLSGGVRWERLTPTSDDEVEFLYVVYEVGGASCEKDSLIRHGGTEYGYVIAGQLGVTIGFEDFELGPGDSISFDSLMPHRLWTIGSEPASAIWVVMHRHGDPRRESDGSYQGDASVEPLPGPRTSGRTGPVRG